MRDLPRQLSVDELAELFEGRTRFVERLAELDDPLGRAREVARALSDDEKKEVLDAHPAIGAPFQMLSFLALSVIPSLKLTDRGLVDVDRFELVPLQA